MSGDTTTMADMLPRASQGTEAPLALVLIASADDPSRVGQTAFVEEPRVLGRKGDLTWVIQRPGSSRATGSLTDPRLSRVQAHLAPEGRGIKVRNTGRAPLFLNGYPAEQCIAAPGDTLRFGSGTALLCVRRRRIQPGSGLHEHPFGMADTDGLVGESTAAWRLRQELTFLGARQAHVLVFGQSGVGKELIARGIHRNSQGQGKLVARNAATIPESLADAELFGNMVNYPNPGMPARPGLIGEASGGTLFLDEFGELPLALQSKMLRVMDDGEYTRLGEAKARRASLRLIAATNRSPSTLKADMLARFPLRLEVPGLPARAEDIPLLAFHLLRGMVASDAGLAAQYFDGPPQGGYPRVRADLMCLLVRHPYATHVRELEALLWHALRTSEGDTLVPWTGFPTIVGQAAPTAPAPSVSPGHVRPQDIDDETLRAALERHGGRQEAVWRDLGLSSRHVLRRLLIKRGLLPTPNSGSQES